jgi:Calcineurin-like phosphoesterase
VPNVFLDKNIQEAEEFRSRRTERLRGKHRISPLPKIPQPKLKSHRILCIGDSHAHPDVPNHRFEWLGRLVADRCPDVVWDAGDSADMASLLNYDKGSKGPIFEGHAYWKDIDVYQDAMERFNHYLKGYRPKLIKTLGNHEYRIEKVPMNEPRFRGVIGLEDLMSKELGWETVPFTEPVTVHGIVLNHYYKSPGSPYPIGGVMPTRAIILKRPGSYCRLFGHTHRLQYFEEFDGTPGNEGRKVTCINVGCYMPLPSSAHEWAGEDINAWRSGLLELEVADGQIRNLVWMDYDWVHLKYGKD